MELTADLHVHTKYSDGHCTVDEQAARAKELGLKTIALTEHGYSHLVFGLKRKEKERYTREIKEAEQKYGVKILVGVEENILGRQGTSELSERDYAEFDLFLAGFHVMSAHETWRDWWNGWKGYLGYNLGLHLKGRLVKDMTQAYVNTVKKNPVDLITHINFQCFADALEVAKCCADYGTYVEISGKKTHFTDDELSDIVQKTGARFLVNSDAHAPERLGDIALAEEQIARVGVPLDRIDNIDGRMPVLRLAEYKKRHL